MAPNNKDEDEEGTPPENADESTEESADEGADESAEDGADESTEEPAAKELEILDEPAGVVSVIEPIEPEDAPGAFVELDEGSEEKGEDDDDDEIEEIDDFEELDDFELVEEDQDEEKAASAAPKPPPPPRPPPPPKMPPPRAAESADEEEGDEEAPSDLAEGTPAPPTTTLDESAEPMLVVPDPVSVLDAFLEGREALDWSKRAAQLTRELDQAEGKTRIGELAYELGELYMRQLEDEASAVKAYGRALQADPGLRANLWAIRRIFYRRELWPNLVKLVGAELRFASGEAQRVDLLTERGRILLHKLEDLPAAQESYEQALSLDSNHIQSLLALERIARASDDKPLLLRALGGLAESSSNPDRRAAFLIELAREHRLSKENYDEAKRLLSEATGLGVLPEALAREREALALAMEDDGAFAASLERRVAIIAESFGDAGVPAPAEAAEISGADAKLRRMVALRRHQAQVLAQGGDSEGAWTCLQEALNLNPQDGLVLVDLADMAESLGRYEELAELVEAREAGEVDPSKALSLALRRASALAKAGKADEADELISARAVANPGYLPLVVARELHAGKRKDWQRMAALQRELADALRLGTTFGPGADSDPEPKNAAAHYLVAGDLLRFGAADSEAAAAHYQLALAACPDFSAAREALVSLLVADKEFSRAAHVLQEESLSEDAEISQAALERLLSVYLFLDQRSDELEAQRRLLALQPENKNLRDRMLELLREQCLYAELATELSERAQAATDPDEAARYLFEAGRLYLDRLNKPSEAAVAFVTCYETWNDDAIVVHCLRDAYRRSLDYQGLLTFLQARLEAGVDDELGIRMGREALAILEFRIKDPGAAAKLGIELATRYPEDLPLLLDALSCADKGEVESAELISLLQAIAARSEGWLRAFALLRLGSLQNSQEQEMDAEESLRQAGEQGALAGILMINSMSAERGNASVTTETLVKLADQCHASENKLSLLERAGWRSMVALEEETSLSQFTQCMEMQEANAGATLGASLLAAKSGDRALQGECLASLAGISGTSYARSSLLLRAGLLADVLGDEKVARLRIEESWAIAPQDAGSAIMAADRLGTMSFEAAGDVQALLSRAELCGVRAALADLGPGRMDWVMERADALERAGRLQEAGQAAALILDDYPEDIRALQTLRRICIRGGDRKNLAHCSLSLASQLGDDEGRLQYLREAVAIFDAELSDHASAMVAYRMILELEPGAGEYARMIEILEANDDVGTLYRCYTARLNHLDVQGDHAARIDILLARAKLRSGIGDIRGASRDLKALLENEPEHKDALLEQARLLERSGDAANAADHYQLFLAVSTDAEQRSSAELSLSYLMVESLDDLQGAIDQLHEVVAQAPDDIELRERLVTLLLQGKRTEPAIDMIRLMSSMRASEGERARDELRIAAVQRDASMPEAALESLGRARKLDPLNMDVIRDWIELGGGDEEKRGGLLDEVMGDLRAAIGKEPLQGGLYQRLASVAQWTDNTDLHRQALVALSFAGSLSADQLQRHEEFSRTDVLVNRVLSDAEWRTALHGSDIDPVAAEVWSIIGPAVSEVAGATPAGLGFERGQRSKGKAVATRYPVVAEMVSWAGIEELEVYVSDTSASVARSISVEVPTLLLGSGIVRASTEAQRFALARAIAHARAGTGTAAGLDPARLCLFFAAAANVAGLGTLRGAWTSRVDSDALSTIAKKLGKALGRRGRKDLSLLEKSFDKLGDPAQWQRAVQASAAKVGLLFCGSLPAAFDVLDVGRGGRPLESDPVAQALMAWSVSPEFLELRAGLSGEEGGHV